MNTSYGGYGLDIGIASFNSNMHFTNCSLEKVTKACGITGRISIIKQSLK